MIEEITEDYSSEVKVLKANILLGEGKIDEAEQLLDSIEDKEDLANIVDVSLLLYSISLYTSGCRNAEKKAFFMNFGIQTLQSLKFVINMALNLYLISLISARRILGCLPVI